MVTQTYSNLNFILAQVFKLRFNSSLILVKNFGSPFWPLRPFHRCPPGAARGPPRPQRHRRGGLLRSPRRGPAPAADGARRGGRDGRLRPHRAALGGARRPRGDLPGAAGGGGRGGRRGRRWPLGPEEMDTRCFGEISGCQEFRTQHVTCKGFGE